MSEQGAIATWFLTIHYATRSLSLTVLICLLCGSVRRILFYYLDAQGNATCYAVGSNARDDFSYIAQVEGESDWSLSGFRLALIAK